LRIASHSRLPFGPVALTAAGPRLTFSQLNHLSSDTSPAGPLAAIPEGFLARSITLQPSRPRIGFADLDCLAVEANPTHLAFALRRFSRRIALPSSRARVFFGDLDNSSVDADPAHLRSASAAARFFRRVVTLAASLPALCFRRLNELFSVRTLNTAPAQFLAMPQRFFRRRITLES
jgi:hypothetical protein